MSTAIQNGHACEILPPQNLEAERAVLAGILLDNKVLHEVVDFLDTEDFYRETHQVIYRAIRDLFCVGKAVDAVTLADELVRRDQYQCIGGDEMLLEIANSVPNADNTRFHAQIIRDKSITRKLIQSAVEIIRDGHSGFFDAQQLLETAEQKLLSVMGLGHHEIVCLRTCDYRLYLLTDHWQSVRARTLSDFDLRCAVCNSSDQLDVHHRTYERRGHEEPGDTIALCRTCHDLFHKNGRLAKPPIG